MLHHSHFLGFVAFGGLGDIVQLNVGALGKVLFDLFFVCHVCCKWKLNRFNVLEFRTNRRQI